MKVYVETYGCAANRNNSEIIMAKALNAGHQLVRRVEDADVIIVNTCTVKHLTEQKIFYRISQLSKTLGGRRLIVTGCMVPIQQKEIRKLAPQAELVEWNRLDKFDAIFGNKGAEKYFCMDKAIGIVQINTGCLGACSFCIVKLIKGNVKSRTPEDIIREIQFKIDRGAREIWITSTDTAAYGVDISTSLPQLIREITSSVEGEYRLRVGMMNPVLLKKFFYLFLDTMDNANIYKFLHMPIQSASKKVLIDMKRPGDVKDFINMHRQFRRRFKESSFATDVIVGYPTEEEVDFEETLKFIKKVKPDVTHVSRFGPRKGTEAAKLKKLPSEVVKERSRLMSMEAKRAAEYRNRKWRKWKGRVLITRVQDVSGEMIAMGRNDAYKQIYIREGISPSSLGKWVEVKIVGYTHSHLEGQIIE